MWPDLDGEDHEGRRPNVVIVQHYAHSAKHYAEAIPFPGVLFLVPRICPDCGAIDVLIRWGTYPRQACTGLEVYWIRVQRVRCKACKHTHSLLPDFLHPYRRYVVARMQLVVCLYLLRGMGINSIIEALPGQHPDRSTVREWITSFAHRAGDQLFDLLRRGLMNLNPLAEMPETPPPKHLDRVPDPTKRRRLANAHRFWQLAELLYAETKARVPRLHFSGDQLLPFVLHWLQTEGVPPRLF